MSSIFISYAHEDQETVTHFVEILRQVVEADVWFDPELRGGEEYFKTIAREICQRDFFIFVASKNAFESDWCVRELNYAKSKSKRIVTVRIDDTPIPDGSAIEMAVFDSQHIYQYSMSDVQLRAALARSVLADARAKTGNGGAKGEAVSADDAAWREQFTTGGTVLFGRYRQDAPDRVRPIEWLVLKNDGQAAVLISKYGLEAKPYNTDFTNVTWENCTLRKWLNEDFLNAAFTSGERAKLVSVPVAAQRNPKFSSTDPGKDTQDRVFLLSIDEANRYFASNDARVCLPTRMAKANGVYTDNGGACLWWLRSPGSSADYAADVSSGGYVKYKGYGVSSDREAVRPVIVLRLS